ncbi:ATP-binding cassette domain-containing protein [Pendulispora brunnea]|uniref:ATP-binding cassette domain-containing protein n=1 Tax=Pendulispora brunnea TaxID=2905690 RepID=A0ABZ2KGE7_9BACT
MMAGGYRAALVSLARDEALWVGLYAGLHFVERLVLVGTALWLLHGSTVATSLSAAGLALTFVARTSARVTLRRRVQARLHRRAVDKLLEGDLLAASAVAEADTEAAIFDGIWSGTALVSTVLPELLADAAASILVIAVLAVVEPVRLLAIGGLVLALAAGGVVLSNRIARREEARTWEAYGPVVDGLVAAIGARLEIVANGMREPFCARRRADLERWESAVYRSTLLIGLASRLPMAVAVSVVGAVVVFERSQGGELTGAMLAHAALFGASIPALANLGRNWLDLTREGVRFAPFAELLRGAPLPTGRGTSHVALPARVTWEGVAVRYAGAAERALDDVHLEWNPGTVLILRGHNGSGKSTLLRTLLAVAPLEGGTVRCGGVDVAELDLDAWRKSVAYLAQRPFLPTRGSAREAFAIVAPDAVDASIERALSRVGLLEVLARREPEAPLSADVGALSVGERQRLALARVLVNDKPLVLLDEPDANLDRAGVELLAKVVHELSAEGRMVAIAAHTDEIIRLGDRVVVLDRGRVA